jgi:two-component sensor histidine kinase/ABC-type nitrate/sulfonate/bicarbonate transport system substrate-binding protein
MPRLRVPLSLVLTLILASAAASSPNPNPNPDSADRGKAAPELEKVALQLKWRHQFQFAGYYMAKKLGYYRDAGLDVEIREAEPSILFTDEVVSGRAQYGVNNSDLLIERASHGKKIVVLAVIFQHSSNILLALTKKGLESPKDFVGKRVMISYDAEAEIISMFSSESIPSDRIIFIPSSWNLDDLVEGRTDAVSAYSTNEALTLTSRGIAYRAIRPITYGIDFYGDCLFTSETELHSHPKRAAAFLAASLKGWAYALDHVDEACDLILAEYSTAKPKAALIAEAKAMDELIVHKLVPIGYMNPGRWRHIGDTYASLGMIPASYDLKGFLYDPDAAKIDPRVLWIALALLTLAVAVAFSYILVLRIFNSRLTVLVAARTAGLEELNRELSEEIGERKKKETIIRESLAEKEVLLKEVHHRTKNNLQVIASLVSLQLSEIDDPAIASLLAGIRNRISGMALVHEQLYSRTSLSSIDMEEYLRDLVEEVMRSFIAGDRSVTATVEAAGISLPLDQANPLGLIVGELVTNSMKHAFAGGAEGHLLVRLTEDAGRCLLRVADDGPGKGKPASERSGKGIGLMLVEALCVQIGGTLNEDSGPGCSFSISFPSMR